MCVFRAHGLDEHSLRTVCKDSTILYAGPAWWAIITYVDAADRNRIGRFMRGSLGVGFTSAADADIDASISSAELKLLNAVQSNKLLRPALIVSHLAQH